MGWRGRRYTGVGGGCEEMEQSVWVEGAKIWWGVQKLVTVLLKREVFSCHFTDMFLVVILQMNFRLLFYRQVFSCHLTDEFPVVI